MNTQSHLIIQTAILTKKNDSRFLFFIVILGSLIPDIPMFIFVYVESVIKNMPEIMLWNELYYDPSWQLFFNIFNSIPLTLVLIIIGLIIYKKNYLSQKFMKNKYASASITKTQPTSRVLLAFGLALLLHEITDLFLHYDDGHAHFLPFSDFIFQSPLSYWDIRHHAYAVSIVIAIAELISFVILFLRVRTKLMKIILPIVCIISIVLQIIIFTQMDNFIHY